MDTSPSSPRLPLEEMLGPIECPEGRTGDRRSRLCDLEESLKQRYWSVMRSHRWVSPDSLPFPWEPVEWFAKGHRLLSRELRPSKSLFYAGGDYFLQDAASLLAIALCCSGKDSLDGEIVCDLCAAPGGKASALLEAVGERGFVLANEPIRSRIPALRYNLARTGSDRYAVSSLDPEQLVQYVSGEFDCVLVDAPCSGQALFSRGKQSQAAFSQKQIDHSAKRQTRILEAAIQLLKPGGRLIYSTCTFSHAENEFQVNHLIDDRGMMADPVNRPPVDSEFVTPSNLQAIESMQTDPGCYRVWPHLHGCAGAFAAALVQEVGSNNDPSKNASTTQGKQARKFRKPRSNRHKPPAELDVFFGPTSLERYQLVVRDGNVFGFPDDAPYWVQNHVETGFSLSGPEIAYRTGRTWKPSHEASLRRQDFQISQHSIEINEEQSIQFMSGQPIRFADDDDHQDRMAGWSVAKYLGRPLGWLKCSRQVGKNHLPSPIRLSGIEKTQPNG